MTGNSRSPGWLAWFESHPLTAILTLSLTAGAVLVGLVLYLDHRIEEREAKLVQQLRPPGEPSGAAPAELPQQIAQRQSVYVSLYSHVFQLDGRRLPLAGTLSIRNTDARNALTVSAIKYYNTEGELVRDYLEEPLKVKPLGSTDFFVPQTDTAGGAGANFIVEWVAEEQINEPIIEAVMVAREGSGLSSFVRSGQVIEKTEQDSRD